MHWHACLLRLDGLQYPFIDLPRLVRRRATELGTVAAGSLLWVYSLCHGGPVHEMLSVAATQKLMPFIR